ncbi:ABC transporter permease [Roseicitreum antarcticum]|uniref:Ribose transport system permease protein n=1 Tax=Roseicitreum antarcticum TaxID=564137 RepID=A0A1H2VBP4_9RHOB|nr:ABC transporter permease [Roseicitreum antarcticum]SDW65650.1 ribose transport system permease protein [Roseicitreum antarcticum]
MQASARNQKHRLATIVGLLPLIIFLALLLYVGLNAPNFMTIVNLKLVLAQSLTVVLSVIGLSAVVMAGGDDVVSGGIDMSIPATAVLCAGIVAVMTGAGQPAILAALAALVAAMLVGVVNAVLVTRLRMAPLLATLAMFVAVVGITNVITERKRLNLNVESIAALRGDIAFGIPLGILIVAILSLLAWFFLHRSKWGLNLQAAGGSRDAAEISGIRVDRLVAQSYLVAAFMGFVTGFFTLARANGYSPGAQDNLLLEMVLATFLGAAFSPRRIVTVWGAILGAVLVAAISIGLKTIGVNVFWTDLIKGALIVIVVALSAISQWAQ